MNLPVSKRVAPRRGIRALFEGLEARQLLAATISSSVSTLFFNDVKSSASGGAGSSPSQNVTLKNTGNSTLSVSSLSLGGSNTTEFSFSGATGAFTLNPGASKTLSVKFTANTFGVRTASLNIKSNDPAKSTFTVNLRGLGTNGIGGNLEPSIQKIFDLFQLPIKSGDGNANDVNYPLPPASTDEVAMQRMIKAGSGNVSIELLAVFANNKSPATSVGWFDSANSGTTSQLFTVPNASDSQSVDPTTSGSTSFDPGSKNFGIYTVFPAFSDRKAYSVDALNTWESKSDKRKIRFFPLKDKNGAKVANAYVFAAEDWNVSYDFNDVVGIIRNVKPGTGANDGGGGGGSTGGSSTAGGGTGITGSGPFRLQQSNGAPFTDRVLFSRISNLDPIRPNVTLDESTLQITNTGSSTANIDSLALGDTKNFSIISGGGSFSLGAGQSRSVTIQFTGTGTGVVSFFNSTLTVNSDKGSKTIGLSAIWQSDSEQTQQKKYSEPTTDQMVKTFGYKINIGNVKTGGKPIKAGDEVISSYWQRASSGSDVKVTQLAAFHRMNNFDPNTGEPLTAASGIRFYYKGSSGTTTKLFTHDKDEGQTLLPNLEGQNKIASASFSPSSGKTFGFKVDSRFSDPSLNPLDYDKNGNDISGTGHAFRFYPLQDSNGNTISNTYLVAMDYTSNPYANYDYNDNLYIIQNIKPAGSSSSSSTSALAKSSSGASLFSSEPVNQASVLEGESSNVL